jgi:2-oxoglutarate ferredoxin oxidoreductase subunit delta
MAGKAQINKDRCKGCGLCVEVCPNKVLEFTEDINKMGYIYPSPVGLGCTGCAMCALVCPEVAIEVFRETVQSVTTDKFT